ncbi:hypothetical protein C350_01713 [Cryptococcus neoformans MW-RSA36]|nr:hypothetical protein C350_01713 [Cryptococcus neoformans var. grubii MW-RSA36]
MNTLYLAPTVSPSDSVPTSTTALFATASDSSTMSSPLPTIHRSLTCPSAIPPLSSHPTPVFKYDDVGMSRTANHTWQEPQSTDNSGAINEKNIDVPDTSVAVVWPPWKRRDGWSGWMGDTVTADSLVWSLIIQAFSTGILDATTSLDFSTFASNQTGNTILLTVAIVRLSGHLLLLTGVSLASFLGGALVFEHLGHLFGLRRRAWLLTNVFFQIVCLTLAAIFLSPSGPAATRLGNKHDWTIIMLFAMMSGAQVAAARQASVQEIPTAPMTSSYVDLVGDRYLFVGFTHKKAGARNRRLGYVLAMITGSFIGAIMHKYAGSWAVVVVAMGFKFAVLFLMSVAPADPRKERSQSV